MVVTPWGPPGRKQTHETGPGDRPPYMGSTDLPSALESLESTFVPWKRDFSHVAIPTQPWAGSCLDDSGLIQTHLPVSCLTWLEGE